MEKAALSAAADMHYCFGIKVLEPPKSTILLSPDSFTNDGMDRIGQGFSDAATSAWSNSHLSLKFCHATPRRGERGEGRG